MDKLGSLIKFFGLLLILLSIFVISATYFPIAKNEVQYQIYNASDDNVVNTQVAPANYDFGIVIPKINANASVIKNVDPYNKGEYQIALTKGIAHARGSAVPGDTDGSVFLFSHSSVNFFEASKYNSIFYLLNKLEYGDEIIVYYLGEKYIYQVQDKKTVNPDEVSYINSYSPGGRVVLMTCSPAGTTLKRLLITAKLVS